MRNGSRLLAATLIAIGLASHGLVAGDLKVDSTDYAKLPEAQQKKLVEELQSQGLLANEDSVVYSGPEVAERRAPPAVLLLLAPLACRAVLAAKKSEDLAQCATKAAEEQDPCAAEVESRLGTADLVCKAIKLF